MKLQSFSKFSMSLKLLETFWLPKLVPNFRNILSWINRTNNKAYIAVFCRIRSANSVDLIYSVVKTIWYVYLKWIMHLNWGFMKLNSLPFLRSLDLSRGHMAKYLITSLFSFLHHIWKQKKTVSVLLLISEL